MTINNAKATTHACPARPTTKSVCPEGAGLIDNASAHESAHTPPQACAAPPSCATAQQSQESPHAQLVEGYEHLFKTHQRLLLLIELIRSDSYAASFQSLGQYRAALLENAGQQSQAAIDVLAERHRQIKAEGWTPEHDDESGERRLGLAAACYALSAACPPNDATAALLVSLAWPWPAEWWKPTTPRRDLVKAGALILAEIERLDRALRQEDGK